MENILGAIKKKSMIKVLFICCANIPRYYKPMYDDYEKIGNGSYRIKDYKD